MSMQLEKAKATESSRRRIMHLVDIAVVLLSSGMKHSQVADVLHDDYQMSLGSARDLARSLDLTLRQEQVRR